MRVRRLGALSLALITLLVFVGASEATTIVTMAANPASIVETEDTVVPDMSNPDYWKARVVGDQTAVLMDASQIEAYNQLALATSDAKMNDIVNMGGAYDASSLASSLANEALDIAKGKNIYVNGTLVDRDEYFAACAQIILSTALTGTQYPRYTVAVSRTDINAWPTNAFIGYSATDSDNEACNSALNVNEPFLVKQQCQYNGVLYLYGYSTNCSGWVLARDLAVCDNRSQWLDAWQTSTSGKDFIVVTQNAFTLESDAYLPYVNGLRLTLGTTLKLVPDDQIPDSLAARAPWHNYVVYVPTRDENGRYVKRIALISEHNSVSVGYLPFTQANIIDVALSCLGDRYGWGGSQGAMDCSLYARNIYKCFGFELPRNTTWQQTVPGTYVDASEAPDQVKVSFLQSMPAGTLLYMPGHAMIYLGTVDGTPYCISALGSVSASTGEVAVRSINSIAITPLTVRRRSGATWLTSITCIVNPRGF